MIVELTNSPFVSISFYIVHLVLLLGGTLGWEIDCWALDLQMLQEEGLYPGINLIFIRQKMSILF